MLRLNRLAYETQQKNPARGELQALLDAGSTQMLFLNPYEPAQAAHAQLDPFQSRATHFPSFFSRT